MLTIKRLCMLLIFLCTLTYLASSSAFSMRKTFGSARCYPIYAKLNPSADTKNSYGEEKTLMNVPEIMALLQETYPSNSRQDWTKTRNYLYHLRSNSKSKLNSTDTSRPVRSKRVRTKNLSPKNIQQIINFLQTTFPNHPKLQAQIIQKSPRILSLHHSIESKLIPTVEFLRGLYGTMADTNGVEGGMLYEAIQRNTDLLLVRGVGYAAAAGWEDQDTDADVAVEEYLLNLGVSTLGIEKLKKSYPTLFQVSLKKKVKPAVEFLLLLLGNTPSTFSSKQKRQISKIITNHPVLFHLDVKSNLEPKARFIQSFCRMKDHELAVVISSSPGILGLSLENNIEPTLQYLLDALAPVSMNDNGNDTRHLYQEESITLLKKSILKHPQILGLSLDNLRAKMNYFDQIECTEDRSDTSTYDRKEMSLAARILLSAPSTYSLSLSNIAEKIQYLADIWGCDVHGSEDNLSIKSDTSTLSDNLRSYPQVLTLSMEGNIKPTMAFYNMSGYIDLEKDGLPTSDSSMPPNSKIIGRYIATSLYNRLLPRWHYLQLNSNSNQTIDDTPIIPTLDQVQHTENVRAAPPPLHLLAGASDKVFCKQMYLSLDEYLSFKQDKGPHLKFNSLFEIWLQTGRPIIY